MTKFNETICRQFYQLLGHKFETEIRTVQPVHSYFAYSEDHFVDICRWLNGVSNVYVGINERVPNGTKDVDVSRITMIFFDIDPIRPKKTPATDDQIIKAKIVTTEFIDYMNRKDYTNAVPIFSGNGSHTCYKIGPLDNTEDNREKIISFGKEIISKINGLLDTIWKDCGCRMDYSFNVSRMVKVPGVTCVTGDGRMTHFIDSFTQHHHEPSATLTDAILNTEIKKDDAKVTTTAELVGDMKLSIETVIRNDRKMFNLFEGHINGYRSRSEAEFALVMKCVYYGLSRIQVDSLMCVCKIGKWSGASGSYRKRTYDKASHLIRY